MAKKYQPSGYQIINLGTLDLGAPVSIAESNLTEDEKILFDIIKSGVLSKPILIQFEESNEGLFSGFLVVSGNFYNLTSPNYDVEIKITTVDTIDYLSITLTIS